MVNRMIANSRGIMDARPIGTVSTELGSPQREIRKTERELNPQPPSYHHVLQRSATHRAHRPPPYSSCLAAIHEYDAKLLLAYWLARAPAISPEAQVSESFVYPTPNVAQIKWDAATNTITPDNTLPPWVFTSKLVAKPDQLIKRRGKSGLLLLNKEWPEAKDWIAARAGKPTLVRFSILVSFHRCFFVQFPPHLFVHPFRLEAPMATDNMWGSNQIVLPCLYRVFSFLLLVFFSRTIPAINLSRSNQSRVLSTHSSSSPSFHILPTLNSTSASTRLARVTRSYSPTKVVSMLAMSTQRHSDSRSLSVASSHRAMRSSKPSSSM